MNFKLITGTTLLENTKANTDKHKAKIVNGCMIRAKGIPAHLKAVNSLRSERLPKVIKDDNKIANGNANGTNVKVL